MEGNGMHKSIIRTLSACGVLILFAGCATPTYDEKMHRIDVLYTQGRYSEAEKELARLAEDKAPEVVPGHGEGGAHE
jgi:hypothetical protein